MIIFSNTHSCEIIELYGYSIFQSGAESPYCFPQSLNQFTLPSTVYKELLYSFILNFFLVKTCLPGGSGRWSYFYLWNACISFRWMWKINAIFGDCPEFNFQDSPFCFWGKIISSIPTLSLLLFSFKKTHWWVCRNLQPKWTEVSRLVQSVLTFFLKNYPSLCKRRVGTEQTSNIPMDINLHFSFLLFLPCEDRILSRGHLSLLAQKHN